MKYGTIKDEELMPLQEGGHSDDAAPGTNNNRISSVIVRAVAVSLALLLSLYAGGYLGSGTHFRHGEMGTMNAAASFSSTSLVGTGTTALVLKTLTIELDDDKNIDILLSEWPRKENRMGGGNPGANCKETSDCVKPPGLDHPVCHDGTCKSGAPGSYCGVTSDCVKPPGLDHPVCRDGRCQSGASSSSCGATSDCVVPKGLEHPVCRNGQCQRGVTDDYCGNDSDCISGLRCVYLGLFAKRVCL